MNLERKRPRTDAGRVMETELVRFLLGLGRDVVSFIRSRQRHRTGELRRHTRSYTRKISRGVALLSIENRLATKGGKWSRAQLDNDGLREGRRGRGGRTTYVDSSRNRKLKRVGRPYAAVAGTRAWDEGYERLKRLLRTRKTALGAAITARLNRGN